MPPRHKRDEKSGKDGERRADAERVDELLGENAEDNDKKLAGITHQSPCDIPVWPSQAMIVV